MGAASKITKKVARAKPTPPAGDNALIEQRKKFKDRAEAKVTPQKGSIATKMRFEKQVYIDALKGNNIYEIRDIKINLSD